MKLKLEQQQRERRRAMEERDEHHSPKWFKRDRDGGNTDNDENWQFNDKYWEIRENPEGFKMLDLDRLW